MKKIMLSILMMTCFAFNGQAQKIVVKADRELGTDFGSYKTFAWASHVGTESKSELYFLHDLTFKAEVRKAVEHELQGLGYRVKTDAPDLLVNFRVFDQTAKIKGYEGYGQGYWGDKEYRQASDTATYTVAPGTLLVSLVDQKQGVMVWQGFASGLIKGDAFLKDEQKIKEAVSLIFTKFGMRATDYDRSSR